MNDTIPALEQFIEPSPISFSPAAPGWYALGIILLIILLTIVILCLIQYRKNRYRRAALDWLNKEEKKYLGNGQYAQLIYTSGMLTKQISIYLNENNETASLRGSEWLSYLSKTCPSVSFSTSDETIFNSIYENQNLNEQQTIDFTNKIKQWIKKHHIKKS